MLNRGYEIVIYTFYQLQRLQCFNNRFQRDLIEDGQLPQTDSEEEGNDDFVDVMHSHIDMC